MSTNTLSALSEQYLSLVRAENLGALAEGQSSDLMTDLLMKAGVDDAYFYEWLEEKGII